MTLLDDKQNIFEKLSFEVIFQCYIIKDSRKNRYCKELLQGEGMDWGICGTKRKLITSPTLRRSCGSVKSWNGSRRRRFRTPKSDKMPKKSRYCNGAIFLSKCINPAKISQKERRLEEMNVSALWQRIHSWLPDNVRNVPWHQAIDELRFFGVRISLYHWMQQCHC